MSSMEGEIICPDNLPFYFRREKSRPFGTDALSLRQLLAQTEKTAIKEALKANRNNKASAARQLGIHRTLLYKKMVKHGVTTASKPENGKMYQ